MTRDQAFLQAIIETPDDDAPRLIYADWLEDHGDPSRAEFIRVQCALARGDVSEELLAELAVREQTLLKEHQGEWEKPFETYAHVRAFRRGFVEAVDPRSGSYSDAPDICEGLAILRTLAPIREIAWGARGCRLEEMAGSSHLPPRGQGDFDQLAACPLLVHLTSLNLSPMGNYPSTPAGPSLLPGLETLAQSPYVGNIASLGMGWKYLGLSGVRIIGESPNLTSLTDLDLTDNDLDDEALRFLANSPRGQQLQRLKCACNPNLTALAVRWLLAENGPPHLSRLEFDVSGFGAEGVRPLLSAPHLPQLTHLGLYHGYPDSIDGIAITDTGTTEDLNFLLRSEALTGLRELTLWGINLGAEGIRALTEGPLAQELVSLTLERCRVGDEEIPYLLTLLRGGRMRKLGLPYNAGLTDDGARRLASCPHLSSLYELDLEDNRLSEAGIDAVATSPHRHRWLRLKR